MDEILRAQQAALREMRQEMNWAEWLADFIWRMLRPQHYAIVNYIHIGIRVPIEPMSPSEEETVLIRKEMRRHLRRVRHRG